MFPTVTIALLVALPAEPPAKPAQPVVKFVSTAKDGLLTFELSNPNAEALPYFGYRSDSFEGGLKEGTIAPLYRVEVLQGKEWKVYKIGWCGTGLGEVSVPSKGKATFGVGLPGEEWDKFRVGVTWFKTADRKELAVAWSDALSKDGVAPKKP
jgi:hypothetical protein